MSSPQPQIAFLVDQLGGGGAQRVAALIARSLHDLGEQTTVLSARGGPFASEIPHDLPVRILAPSWPSPVGVLQFLYNLRRTVRREEIEVIFTNGFTIGRLVLFSRALGQIKKVTIVVVEHNTLSVTLHKRFTNGTSRGIVLRLTGWLYRGADAIIGVSEGVARDLEETLGLSVGSVTTIRNPIDQERIKTAIAEVVAKSFSESFESLCRPIVISSGRLVAQKAHSDLLQAFALLPEDFRGSLVILGEGPLRHELERQASELGIANAVWMPGFVENPWWFIARSDAFALSSHWEGFGLVLVEALVCGTPVASTDCPSGPREILAGEPSAFLAPVAHPAELSRAIQAALKAPRDFSSHRERASYDPTGVAVKYLKVAQELAR